jgi:hypothetical protein
MSVAALNWIETNGSNGKHCCWMLTKYVVSHVGMSVGYAEAQALTVLWNCHTQCSFNIWDHFMHRMKGNVGTVISHINNAEFLKYDLHCLKITLSLLNNDSTVIGFNAMYI